MDLGPTGNDVVAYEYEQSKYCKPCFYQAAPLGKKIKFGPVIRAVQVQSQLTCCDGCGRNLLEVDEELRGAGVSNGV